ncbi:hypothetical protein R3P38DRAFT_3173191 [Favolaschia claudopus]|uniref:Uncharacterized protein n=1 Tax=Favolaschia claudopus TaxID=2862362 RepID=A0AAW0DFL3_9AGAR
MAKNGRVVSKRKRTSKRVAKKDRRNLKLWAEGAREEILAPHIAAYTDALERGWRAERDYLAEVCKEFHARISWRLTDVEEPDLPLPEFDRLAIPEVEELDEEEKALKRLRVETLNARIGRWLKYRARRLRKNTSGNPLKDPWALYLAKLSGILTARKARQGYQQYMHESYSTDIDPVVQARWKAKFTDEDAPPTTKGIDANFRATVARELFKELPEEEQEAIRQRARDEAQKEKEEYIKKMKDGPSKAPADRQVCIDNLGVFMTNVHRGVHERTGLVGFSVFGGPMPASGGELRTLTISHGMNREVPPCHFPQWSKARFGREVLDFMKEWLKTAYTAEDCREAALPSNDAEGDADPLAGAKYKIDDNEDLGWGSDDDSDASSTSASDSEDDDSEVDSEVERDVRGKRKAETKRRQGKTGGKKKETREDSDEDESSKTKSKRAEKEKSRKKEEREKGDEKEKEKSRKRKEKEKEGEGEKDKAENRKGKEKEGEKEKKGGEKDKTENRKGKEKEGEKQKEKSSKRKEKEGEKEKSDKAENRKGKEKEGEKEKSRNRKEKEASQHGKDKASTSGVKRKTTDTAATGDDDAQLEAARKKRKGDEEEQRGGKKRKADDGGDEQRKKARGERRADQATPADDDKEPSGSGADGGSIHAPSVAGTPPPSSPSRSRSPPLRAPQPNIPECPADAAQWFREVYKEVTATKLGDNFNALLVAMIELERAYEWEKTQVGLKTTNRPSPVSSWIRAGRGTRGGIMSGGFGPSIGNIVKYEEGWWDWWRALQPAWRVKDAANRFERGEYPQPTAENWLTLRAPGPNGSLSLVASLYWWGQRLEKVVDSEEKRTWVEAVTDVKWMLRGLCAAQGKVSPA